MSKALKPWRPKWVEIDDKPFASGGQGEVWRVQKSDEANAPTCAGKILSRPRNEGRRKRFRMEILALQTLRHDVIPNLLDSNVEQYDDLDVLLFAIIEWVQGPTLEQHVDEQGPMELERAIALVLKLVDGLAAGHELGIVHRDVKPDNIALRDALREEPVLLDFGMAFLEVDDAVGTLTEEQVGNRFLELPELRTPGSDKHDHRSDLTSAVGLLYYALTGFQPRTLLDENQRKPHRRERYVQWRAASGLNQKRLAALDRVFDVAFEQSIALRFQSAEQLRSSLQSVLEPSDSADTNLMQRLASKLQADETLHANALEQRVTNEIRGRIGAALRKIADLAPSGALAVTQSGWSYGIIRSGSRETVFSSVYSVIRDGAEVRLHANDRGRGERLLWSGMVASPDFEACEESVRDDAAAAMLAST